MPQPAPKSSEIVEIVRIGHAGDGVTEDGVYVPYTLPGDVVKMAREGGRGRVIDLVKSGPARVAPPCQHFGRCGGCALQHVAQDAYLAWKRDLVINALKQRGLADVEVEDIRTVARGTRRRASFKARLSGDGVLLGFYEAESRNLVDLSECPILLPQLAALTPRLRKHLAPLLRASETAELLVTATDSGIDLALTLKRAREPDLLMQLAGLSSALKLARLSWNSETVAMAAEPILRVGRFTLALPPGAFLQPTREGETMLRDWVRAAAAEARSVADLFSGCGTFALALTEDRRVSAYDNVPSQIEALATAAKRGGAQISAQTRDLFRRPLLPTELARFDLVVLDPPRPGASAQAKALAESRVPKVLYVSCNAASFARDARLLVDGGYRLNRVHPLDQFLWSPHVELFAEFER